MSTPLCCDNSSTNSHSNYVRLPFFLQLTLQIREPASTTWHNLEGYYLSSHADSGGTPKDGGTGTITSIVNRFPIPAANTAFTNHTNFRSHQCV
ncbi:hypothetical protein [Candidatus Pandoraea novymonadis]|uniref:hypothetical protein n=1 Tax=Candidatus Pandoraea novymonadis TaxID=1808959 RepID=UPI0011B28C27|nr:hypothetical protein [Candidatus Pandoraea novymonadis]